MNRQNAALVSREQIINEVADDRIWFVAELRDDPADQGIAASMPFEIDRTVRGFAVDFSPAVRATRTLMFSGNQIKTPKLRVVHDFVP